MMPHTEKVPAVLLLTMLLSACGTDQKEEDTVFDPLVDTLDRAEQVDQISKDRLQNLNERIDREDE